MSELKKIISNGEVVDGTDSNGRVADQSVVSSAMKSGEQTTPINMP